MHKKKHNIEIGLGYSQRFVCFEAGNGSIPQEIGPMLDCMGGTKDSCWPRTMGVPKGGGSFGVDTVGDKDG